MVKEKNLMKDMENREIINLDVTVIWKNFNQPNVPQDTHLPFLLENNKILTKNAWQLFG